jgi:hypothetical protein
MQNQLTKNREKKQQSSDAWLFFLLFSGERASYYKGFNDFFVI